MSVGVMNTEYMRLGGHLPTDLLVLIKEYAQPMYRKPPHFRVYSPMLSGIKSVIIWRLLKQEYPQCRGCAHKEAMNNSHYSRFYRHLLPMQTGELFEEDERMNYIIRDILTLIRREKKLRKNGN